MFDIASYFDEIYINIYSYKKYNRKKIKRIIPFVKDGVMLCSSILIDDIFPIMNIYISQIFMIFASVVFELMFRFLLQYMNMEYHDVFLMTVINSTHKLR